MHGRQPASCASCGNAMQGSCMFLLCDAWPVRAHAHITRALHTNAPLAAPRRWNAPLHARTHHTHTRCARASRRAAAPRRRKFPVTLVFPKEYPSMPPKAYLPKGFLHPNVYPEGLVCLSILNGDPEMGGQWAPALTVGQVSLVVVVAEGSRWRAVTIIPPSI
eukprot:355127-Chlamydomonas_euryale.AAC.10